MAAHASLKDRPTRCCRDGGQEERTALVKEPTLVMSHQLVALLTPLTVVKSYYFGGRLDVADDGDRVRMSKVRETAVVRLPGYISYSRAVQTLPDCPGMP